MDANDLQLEDVEDYAADYTPTAYPPTEENIAAVGVNSESHFPKKRNSQFMHLVKSNKWVSGLAFLLIVVVIAVIAIAAGGARSTPSSSSSGGSTPTFADPVAVDPDSLDPVVVESLMSTFVSAYSRNGLDSAPLDDGAGDTPQRLAFHWMASDELTPDLDHTQTMQRYSLASLFYATNNVPHTYETEPMPWLTAHLWLSDAHVCVWHGITCNDQDHVEEIDLADNNLSGAFPPELAFLSSTLTSIDVTGNLIYMRGDDYDVFTPLTKLETLLLEDNYFYYENGIPSHFAALTSLKKINLSRNVIGGELETDHKVLAKMPKLTHLEIEFNHISGSMPAVVGELSNLVYIYMRANDMSFNLNFLKTGKLTDLFTLWLDANDITGTLPTELGLLTELASLSITNTTLTGTLPTQLANLSGLRRVWLYSNELSGTIPAGFGQLSELEVLELHDNDIGGSMPQGVCAIIDDSQYESKSLTADCKEEVECSTVCCTACY